MRIFLLPLLLAYSLFAGTYDYEYSVKDTTKSASNVENDFFMKTKFEEIVRFDMLWFDSNELDVEKHLEYITKTIKDYIKDGKNIRVKIIGHTKRPTDNHDELVVDSDTYANAIQNIFRYELDTKTSENLSKSYANDIQKRLINSNIDESIMVVEHRRGDDMAFTDSTSEGRDLSNRVMVTMYVLVPKNLDSDNDGVFDNSDKCPDTPKDVKVDKVGCPLDIDKDGVYDYEDKCPNTPEDVKVNKNGCAIDSDKDTVVDYKDKCPDTKEGLKVDINGCPFKMTLTLNFKTNSENILSESHSKIIEFATFLKENPAYDAEIIGHTDSIGKSGANIILSQKRAASTKTALISEGIESSRLTTRGRGELDPIKSNRTADGRKINRRIEVILSIR